MAVEQRLAELGLTVPEAAKPVASYVPAVQTGNLVFISGQVPTRDGQVVFQGQLGGAVSEEEGIEAARLCALNCLAAAKALLGDLDRVRRVVRVTGYVNSTPDFTNQPKIVNGASDLLVHAFGEAGQHSRAAVGMAQLPLGVAVEVDMILEVS